MAASLLTADAAKALAISMDETSECLDLGGAPVPILGSVMLELRIAKRKVARPAYIVPSDAIPIAGCKLLMTADDADALSLTRKPGRLFYADGMKLNTFADIESNPPVLPAIKGKVLTTKPRPSGPENAGAADRSAIEFLTAPELRAPLINTESIDASTEDIGEDPTPGLTLKFEQGSTLKRTVTLNGIPVEFTVGAGLDDALYERLDAILIKYQQVFYYPGRKFTHKLPVKHVINTTARPRRQPPRSYHGKKLDAVRAIHAHWRERGLVRPCLHPEGIHYENPLHIVVKDESKPNLIDAYRATLDGRATNEVTVRNRPRSDKTVRSIANHVAKLPWITKLDGKDFYLQMEIQEQDKHKSAHTVDGVRYEFVGAIFGLAFPGDTVEANMELITAKHKESVKTFVDDFFVGGVDTTNPATHLDEIEAWLATCAEYDLVLNTKDPCFLCPKVIGLGFRMGSNTIAIPYDRRTALKNLARPNNREILNVALATYNFYSSLIPHYADFNVRFRPLLKANAPWIWTGEHEAAWEDFKKMLDDEEHGIAMPYDDTKPVVIRPDASDYGLGATMLQYDPVWRKLRPVLYFSAPIDDADVKIASTTVKEAFSGHAALMHWAPLLAGKRILMQYDHLPIIGFVPKNSSSAAKHWRWFKDYQAFDLKFEHVPGKENSLADLFSRLLRLAQKSELPDPVSKLLAERQESDTAIKDIRDALLVTAHKVSDTKALELLKAIGGLSRVEIVCSVAYCFFPGRYRQRSRRVLLPDSLIKEYLDVAHADPTAGHLRGDKFRDRLNHVYWLNKEKDIAKIESDCLICHRVKSAPSYTGPLTASGTSPPFSRWVIDFFEIFSQKFLVAVDSFSGYPEAIPVSGELAGVAIEFVHTELLCRHGPFKFLRSDQGPAFTAEEFKSFCKKRHILQEHSDPERPEGHGAIERLIRTLEEIMRCIFPSLGNNIPRTLSTALWAYRSASQASHGFSPFELRTGIKPLLNHPLEIDPYSDTTDFKEFAASIAKNLDFAMTEAIENKSNYQAHMQRSIDSRARPHPFKLGDLVGIKRPDFDKNNEIARFDGPFKILDLPTPNTAIVDIPPGPKSIAIIKLKNFTGTEASTPLPGPSSAEKSASAWTDPPKDLLPEQLLFKRVKVLWNNKNWFTGTVKSIWHNKHFVLYDDKDSFDDPFVPEGLTLPKKRPKYRVLSSDFAPTSPKS
jgi:transposase InsO family protein